LTYTTKDGAKVTAGQQIAWNGDSGDADGNPHLHFELHPDDGADVNPFPFLKQAIRTLIPARVGSTFTVGLRGVPIRAGGGRLTIRATAMRWWPGGRWTPLGPRDVEVAIGPATRVDRELAGQVMATTEAPISARKGVQYSIFTSPAKATVAAIRGEPGALLAARVSRPGATLVPVEPTQPTEPSEPPVDDGYWGSGGDVNVPYWP
jgi:hypothetical protein